MSVLAAFFISLILYVLMNTGRIGYAILVAMLVCILFGPLIFLLSFYF